MATAGWMDRMMSDLTRRREDLLATVSQRALDALEAVEKVEDVLAKAPEVVRDWRTKAADRLELYAKSKGVMVEDEGVRDEQAAEQMPAPYEMPERQARAKAPQQRAEAAPTSGRKTVQAATSAKRATAKPAKQKKAGFAVKRGQKHTHDR